MLLQIQDGTLSIGGQTVLSHFDFEIRGNEKIAIVGRNGSGKTTLLRLLFGELSLERDDKSLSAGITFSRKITTGLLSQQAFSDVFAQMSVEEALLAACPCKERWDRERFVWEQEFDRIFTGFGLKKEDKKKKLSQFSGGEQTKIALIRLLLLKPDVLLLDEPTNHLDMAAVEWLEDYLTHYEKAAVIVSHDRFFLDRTAESVYEIQNQKLIRYAGNYTAYRAQKQKNIRLQEKAYRRTQEEQERLTALIERFKHKPKKAAFARSRKKMLERMPQAQKPLTDDAHIFMGEIVPSVRSSKWVLEAEHLKIGRGSALLELSVRIRRGQKIGIIGPNGTGKSTFLKTAAGLLAPVGGRCALGLNVTIGYFDQQTAAISSDETVAGHFHALFPALTEKEVRSLLGAFLFSGKNTSKRVADLSGGEKARLILAELIQSRPNLFLLDEPTNHMDIPARETLESAFKAYTGTLLFISHDRYFINQVAESLLIFDEGSVLYYPFGYEHYLEHCRSLPDAGSHSARIRAEEQALISGLQNVPRAERHRLREISTEQAYEDWQLSLAREPLENIRAELERLYEEYDAFYDWMDPKWAGQWHAKERELIDAYSRCCLDWYDKWSEFHPEEPSSAGLENTKGASL